MTDRAEIINAVCAGNADAARFCTSLVEYVHFIDDSVDRDKHLTAGGVVRIAVAIMTEAAFNPFFQEHKASLTALLVQAFRAWADSCQWEKRESVQDRRAADVLKGVYHEAIFHVAYLVGGWQHLSDVTEKYRHYDFDCKD